ncbi:MAG: META domain-containing protein [Desulfobacteraceae bacterium]|nr:META domain-containing protein [Desulfobacteraceae bacterium]
MRKKVLLIFIGLFFILSCVPKSPVSNVSDSNLSLFDTHWKLVKINGQIIKLKGNHNDPFIKFDKETGRVSGNTGCNRFFGKYKIQDSSLTIEPLAMTRKACKGWMDQEHSLTKVLDQTTGFKIQDTFLLLMNGETIGARYQAENKNQ